MVRLLSRIIFSFFSNLLALLAASYLVSNFKISGTIKQILFVALVFALINLLIRPIIKLILSPIIIFSFGLAIIAINAFMLWLLKYFLPQNVSITGLKALFYATLIISLTNIIIGFSARSLYKN